MHVHNHELRVDRAAVQAEDWEADGQTQRRPLSTGRGTVLKVVRSP